VNPLRWFGRGRAEPPRVSIVMPSLNQARFIGQAIASVMAQLDEGLELVVADGGSSDGTLELLAAAAAAHPGRLRWASAPDGGPAQAVNAAVAQARGAIIGWLNSDDLYAPGAVARALARFRDHEDEVLVYGAGEHIDDQGTRIGPYPTREPATPLADWADGCHICQPTAFLRREVFTGLGGLDPTLRAAFDYDFWLRLLKAYPGRIGCLAEVQAQSRLHAGAITLRMRECVALEGMRVVHRHIGPAPAHWLLTHFDELQAGFPFEGAGDPLQPRLRALVAQAAAWLAPQALDAAQGRLSNHRALQLAQDGFFATVQADGWAPPVLDLRLRQPPRPYANLRLSCRHASPRGGRLRLDITAPDGESRRVEPRPGPFEIDIPLRDQRPQSRQIFRVVCANPFVPADCEAGSTDRRPLAFQVDAVRLQPAP
jgi:hypothetical protein